ncbi:HEAT repeat domain-containing protein [Marinobacter fonticola]|uniref:HEAT repeat domain-containing protein n=1 Tax=Marinobacter fonticola TaxID=2603215 RepID=UPI0011E86B54|nr:HEAT repeat domain-containing protein [Marinobacter fonticola]
MGSNWLIAQAVVLEIAGIVGLASPLPSEAQLLAYLAGHAIACALLAVVLLRLLPKRYQGSPRRAALFLFSLQFAIPLIGSIGVALGVLLALYLPRSEREVPWQEIAIPELPYKPIDMSLQMVYSQGGLRQILREASDPEKRLKALLSTRQMQDRDAVQILREALRDKVDDVRLLAYSMLEQKEKALTHRANRLQQALTSATDEQTPRLQRRLAQAWWEMGYLGLAQGGLRIHYLKSAQAMLQRLIQRRPQHNDWRLLGRVELELGNLETAREAFHTALDKGAPDDLIRPYLAEVAFHTRDLDQVRAELAACSPNSQNSGIRSLVQAWL